MLPLASAIILASFFFLCTSGRGAQYHAYNPKLYCTGIEPQENVDLEQIMGLWYLIEVVHHTESQQAPGVTIIDDCPLIRLDRPSFLDQYFSKRIQLTWNEEAGVVQYNFNVPNLEKPGRWFSFGPQNGSLLRMPYRQFAGNVDVTKAVGTHLVLTFCMPNTELYSVVLSRERSLPFIELHGVNSMLERRGLHRISVREACKGAASAIAPTLLSLLGVFAFRLQ